MIIEDLELANCAIQEDNIFLLKSIIQKLRIEFSVLDMNLRGNQTMSFNFGSILIDYGKRIKEKESIIEGMERIKNFGSFQTKNYESIMYFYNLANGYSALRKLSTPDGFENGYLSSEFLDEILHYRKAILLVEENKIEKYEFSILPLLFTNYGNSLDDIGRPIEAIEYINKSIKLDPNNATTLANKAMIFESLVLFAQDNKAVFVLEAKRLIDYALKRNPMPELKNQKRYRVL